MIIKPITILIVCLLFSLNTISQDIMRITQKDGTVIDIPLSEIRKLTFSEGIPTTPEQQKMFVEALMKIKSYPNPGKDLINLEFNLEENGTALIQIYNLQGKLIETNYMRDLNEGKHIFKLNSQSYATGTYLCKITFNDKILIEKLIVKK